MPMMKTLYITRPGTLVRRDNHALTVERDGRTIGRQPLADLGRVVLWGGVELSTGALRMLVAAGVDVALLTRRGRYLGGVVAPFSGAVAVRLAQTVRFADPDFALRLARRLVRDKLTAQAHLLRTARKRGGPDRLKPAIRELDQLVRRLDQETHLDALRGIEGHGARIYFDAFAPLVPAPFTFAGRNRRPPRDPVNALLSLGYVLLTNEIAGDVQARGLDPRLGFLHTLRAGRPAFALDLLEPWRAPAIDRLVLNVLGRRTLKPTHFRAEGDAVLLTPEGLPRFLEAYDRHLGRPDETGLRHRIAAYIDGIESTLLDGR